MAVQVSYPGVYIDEFTPGAPIQGVGTSTVAFLGASTDGPLNEPTKITSWDQFGATFGALPLPGFYLWYAVRGFFENGGAVCYVTRVSNAAPESFGLNDISAGAGQPTIRLRARQPGDLTPPINVTVDADVHTVTGPTARLFRPTATITTALAGGTGITVANADEAARFRPGDVITWTGSTETGDVRVVRIEGATIRVAEPLVATYSSGTVRLANLDPSDTVFRMENGAGLGPGSVIRLRQDPGGGATPVTTTRTVHQVDAERISPTLTTYHVELRQGLGQPFDLSPGTADVTVESYEFRLTVSRGATTRDYTNLGMDPAHPNYYQRVVGTDPNGLIFADPVSPPNVSPPPDNRPRDLATTPLTGGVNDNPPALAGSDYRAALALLERIDDVNLVVIPDTTAPDVQMAMIAHCENMKDRFAVLDSRPGASPFGVEMISQRAAVDTARGFAALYYPWLWVPPALGDAPVLVPPSGHVAGIYARTDAGRGVHKAPAGTEATVSGALGVERVLSDVDQGQLNLQGINVIRVFTAGGRPLVWGARTTATDRNWQYVNIRRLFLFIEESIQEGIRWAVFEPNNLGLWQRVKQSIVDFLSRVWRDGALFGERPDQAFYVRIDEALNPFAEQQLGRLNIEVGIRPAYPAEFIIVRIGIWPGGSEVSET